MNIGLLNDSFPPTIDGVANAVKNYADIINESLGKATVITPEYPNIIDNRPYEVYRYSSIKFKGQMPYRVGNPFSPITLRELSKKRFDLLHAHCPFASAVLAKEIQSVSGKNKMPIVFTYHTKFDVDIDNFVTNKRLNSISKRFVLNNINTADEVWSVSQGAIESLRKIGYTGEVLVMPNGTDFKRGKSDIQEIYEVKRIHGLKDDIPLFLFCGRMMWYKNIKLILDGLKIVADSGCKFRSLFVGDGPDRSAIEYYARNIGLDDSVVSFLGAIYDRKKIRAYFSCADLFLFPSTYDTSGLVVKEAAACACPSILVKNSCAAEGVTDMQNGLLIEENADDFAKKIISTVSIPDFYRKLGLDAEKNVYISWEDSVNKAYNRYGTVIENFYKNNK